MKKMILSIFVVFTGSYASAAIVASQVSCNVLKAVVAAGETQVIGKTGKVYQLESECGLTHIFRSTNGLCVVHVPGQNMSAQACEHSNISNHDGYGGGD
ncbi:MAG: hypothetical protein ACK5P5_12745 [Pseudobdellovibrionaceae bacterium]